MASGSINKASGKNTYSSTIDLLQHIDSAVTIPEDGWLYVANNPGVSATIYVMDANGQTIGALGVTGGYEILNMTKGMKVMVYNYSQPTIAKLMY